MTNLDSPKHFIPFEQAKSKAEAAELMPDWVGDIIQCTFGFVGFLSAEDYRKRVHAAKA